MGRDDEANWLNGASPNQFYAYDNVFFDDTASQFNVNLTSAIPAAGIMVTNNSNNYTFSGSGNIQSGSLVKQGSGTLTLADAGNGGDNYDQGIIVGKGSLIVSSSIAASAVTVQAGATLIGTNNIAINGPVTVSGSVSPGGLTAVGTLATEDETWNAGGSYIYTLNSAVVAVGQDKLNISGGLNVQATAANPFKIKLVSLNSGNAAGALADFVSGSTYTWVIASVSSGITNFNPAAIVVDTSSFSNSFAGTFSVTTNGNALVVNYVQATLVAPTINGGVTYSGGALGLSFSGPSGQTYKVLTSTNLTLPLSSWQVQTTGTFGAGPVNYMDTSATNRQKFYTITSP